MSNFASIAVLSKPTEQHPDWEFEMEGLKFEVHEGLVELNQEITDFDKFCTSMESLFALVDSIDMNRGRLDEAVYSLVNQNNELAEALGIYTPFSFATEEEQAQAGQEVKDAVNNGDKKDEEKKDGDSKDDGDDKGFFAKAWDAIKRFFGAIKNALIRVWGAITGSNKNAQAQADEISSNAQNATPATNGAIGAEIDKVNESQVQFRTINGMTGIKNACADIANTCAKIPADPAKFIAWKGNNGGIRTLLNGMLGRAGYKVTTETQNGVEVSSAKLERTKEDKAALKACWTQAGNRTALSNLCREMGTCCDKIQKTIENLTAASEKITGDPKAIDAMAAEMAKGTWKDRPHVKAKISTWKWLTGKSAEIQARADAHNAAIDAHNATMKNKAIDAKREMIQAAMLYEKELADYCKEILNVVKTLKGDFEATINYLYQIEKRIGGIKNAKANRAKAERENDEKARNEANARDAQAYRDAANASVTKSMQEDDKKNAANHAEDMDTATPDYDNN